MSAEPVPVRPPSAQPPAPSNQSPRPLATTTAVLIAKTITEVVALCFVGALAILGKIAGEWALGALLLIAGVRIADILAFKSGPPGSGAGGMGGIVGLVLAGGHALHALLRHIGGGPAALVLLASAAGASAAQSGCTPPQLPPIAGCVPRDTRCAGDGIPEVCSGSQRWTRLHDTVPCAAVGLVCCRNAVAGPDPIFACAPAGDCITDTDGGTNAR